MLPSHVERLKELNENMLDWICEHIKDDDDLFYALYNRIGFAPSELDSEIESRVYKMYQALSATEQLRLKVNAEYAEFQAHWRTLSPDELIEKAEKIAIVNRVKDEILSSITPEQAKYFAMFVEPLEAISDTILNNDYAHESELVSLALSNMYDAGDGGAYYDMEEEYYSESNDLTQKI